MACSAAIIMQRALTDLRREWEKDGKPLFKARMGINTGPMTIGNVGSKQRLSYTVIGDTVNLAARLEAINKQYRSYTMISGSTYEEVKDLFHIRELDMIQVKGKSHPVKVYELIEEADTKLPDDSMAVIRAYTEGLKWYREKEWEQALRYFEKVLKIDPNEYPSILHIDRCHHFIKNPPPPDWDGAWIYTTK